VKNIDNNLRYNPCSNNNLILIAFKNGNKEKYARMAAPTLKIVSSHTSP
jgi:hypothetical protein